MTTAPLKAIVVGTGFGCRIHVPALRAAGFEVVGLVGAELRRTTQRAEQNGVAGGFADLEEAISQTGADVVTVATPPHTHCPLAVAAFERGCHVLCEKPFARDSAEARAMLTAARKSGKVHLIGNEFRFVPQRAAAARAIADGLIGEPRFATFVQIAAFVKYWERDFPDWWFEPAEGGGWLGASGSHVVDQIRSWLGEFDSVSASLTTVALTRGPVDDSYSVRFRLKNGLEGVMQQSSAAYGPLTELTAIAGDKGRIWLDGGAVRFADGEGERNLPIPVELSLPPPPPLTADPRNDRDDWKAMAQAEIAPYTELCKTFRALILGETPRSPVQMASFADGLANMEVIDAIRRSAREGGSLVKVGEVSPHEARERKRTGEAKAS